MFSKFAAEMACDHPTADATEAMRSVRQTLQTYAFLERCEDGLQSAAETLCALRVDVLGTLGTPAARQAAQAKNAVDAARLIVCAMRKRRDSRGGHNRVDYPTRDPNLSAPLLTGWQEAQSGG